MYIGNQRILKTTKPFIPFFLIDTTRTKKSYEMNGREYHYVSKETFESLIYSHR